MNIINILGQMVRDVELTKTTSGIDVAKFTVAVQRQFTNASGERETDFLNCVAFRNTAEFVAKWFKKGQKIALTGRLQVRNYDNQEGKKVYVSEIVAEQIYFAGDNKGQERTEEDKRGQTKLEPIDNDASLPF